MEVPTFEDATILIVEDTQMMRVLMTRYLKQAGFQNIIETHNGKEGLEALESHQIDLILLDINMPVMDGYQALEAIRADAKWKELPVIMITAVDDIESVARCIEMGAEDYMPKLFNPILLKSRILSCLEKRFWKAKALEG